MCVLLFDAFNGKMWNIYYLEKLVGKVNFLERKFEGMH